MSKKTSRQKVAVKMQTIQTREEADRALAEIAIAESRIKNEEAAYNQREQITRAKLTESHAPLRGRISELLLGLKSYCEQNREEFGKKKSLELQHGILSFRTGNPKVVTLKGFTLKSALELIRRSPEWFGRLVRTEESVNKEKILELHAVHEQNAHLDSNDVTAENLGISEQDLAVFGLAVVQEETFGYEIKLAVDGGAQ